MVSFGALYHLVKKLWNTEMYSDNLVNVHFWVSLIGAVIYIVSMWVSGIMQGLMWRDYDDYGALTYSFVETVSAMHPYYVLRGVGGALFLLGGVIMLYNVVMTIRQASASRDLNIAPVKA